MGYGKGKNLYNEEKVNFTKSFYDFLIFTLSNLYKTINLYLLHKRRLLFRSAILEELLYDIISKHICHETVCIGDDLLENGLFLLRSRSFQLLLDESGSVLILGELDHVTGDVAQLHVRITIVSGKRDKY